MKTKWLGVGLATACVVSKTWAVFGVGDVVIVASNPAQEMLWAAEELPKWLEMIDQAKQQVNRAQQMIDLVGHPEQIAGQALQNWAPALEATQAANALKSTAETLDFTKQSWNLYKGLEQQAKDVLSVGESFEVFGEKVLRDRERYLPLAKEKALRARLDDALKKKQEIDSLELEFQQRTATALKAARTQTEIALHQASLVASKQRMEAIAARVVQAESELKTYVDDQALEMKKKVEEVKEADEATVKRALERIQKAETVVGAPSWNDLRGTYP